MIIAKYFGRYFFSLKEISLLTHLPWHSVKKFIEKKQIFAVKIGKDWRIFWDQELENAHKSSTSFDLPDILHSSKISDILYVSEFCVKRYVLRSDLHSISKQQFSQFLMRNSNLQIFGEDCYHDYQPMSEMVSTLLRKQDISHTICQNH